MRASSALPVIVGLVIPMFFSCAHAPPPFEIGGKPLLPADRRVYENLVRHLTVLTVEIGSRSILQQEKLDAAAGYISREFTGMDLAVRGQEYEVNGRRAVNIIARGENFDPSKPAVLLGAHYDTVPGTPGADDNASAVAVLLETARQVSTESPASLGNVLFVAFSTEEPPSFGTDRMGSRVFVEGLKDLGCPVGGAFILEMVGYFDHRPGTQNIPSGVDLPEMRDAGNFLAFVADGQSAGLGEKALAGYRKSPSRLEAVLMVFPEPQEQVAQLIRLSDHSSFWDAGIPAVMVTDTAFLRNPNYHERTDRMSTLSIPAMENVVLGMAGILKDGAL